MADWRATCAGTWSTRRLAYLSDAFEEENFHFYSDVLRGMKQMQPRWKRVVMGIDGMMGEALGALYVEKHFPPAAKERMDELVKNSWPRIASGSKRVDWMGPETKQQALAKLATVMPKIGYPDNGAITRAGRSAPIRTSRMSERAEAFDSRIRSVEARQAGRSRANGA